ncbi:hypothetical protein D3C80_2169980 [compost metagenome]
MAVNADSILRADWKLGVLRFRLTKEASAPLGGTAFSTMAPPGIRPTVGTFTVTLEPSPPSAEAPPTTKLPWAKA